MKSIVFRYVAALPTNNHLLKKEKDRTQKTKKNKQKRRRRKKTTTKKDGVCRADIVELLATVTPMDLYFIADGGERWTGVRKGGGVKGGGGGEGAEILGEWVAKVAR